MPTLVKSYSLFVHGKRKLLPVALNLKPHKGFTLIELMVSVSIIALLSVIGITGYSTFMQKSRDAKRQADLSFLQGSLEQYFADQKYYPYSATLTLGSVFTNATGAPGSPAITKTYMNSIPGDPSVTPAYTYESYKANGTVCSSSDAGLCTKYCLYARAEKLTQMTNLCTDKSGFTLEITSP